MAVLADNEIFKALKAKRLVVHPLLNKNQIKGARIDLRLDNIFYVIKRFAKTYYDPMNYMDTQKPEPYGEVKLISYGSSFALHPGDYVLAPLFEFVKIPNDLLGKLSGRSSLGRLGIIVHCTAEDVDPGYAGPLIVELANIGMFPVALYPLMEVASLTLEEMTGEATYPYRGKYGKIEDFPETESKLYRHKKELRAILEMKRLA